MSVPVSTRLFSLSVLLCVLGCSSESSKDDWQEVLSQLAKDGQSFSSFLMVGEPPQGMALEVDIHESTTRKPCELYEVSAAVEEQTPFWYLAAKIGRTVAGEYPLSSDLNLAPEDTEAGSSEGPDRGRSSIRLTRVEGEGKKALNVLAVSGSVTVVDAPQSIEEAKLGKTAKIKVAAVFPTEMLGTESCDGAVGVNDGSFSGTCTCADSDGKTSTCELESSTQETCCASEGEVIEFNVTLEAESCPAMCRWLMGYDELAQYCLEL